MSILNEKEHLDEILKAKCLSAFDKPFIQYILISTHQQETAFENIVGKG